MIGACCIDRIRSALRIVAMSIWVVLPAAAQTEPASILPQELAAIDHSELGEKYNPNEADIYLKLHALIENYFAATSSAERKTAADAIAATRLDPNLIGRLVRIHMDWAALSPGCQHIEQRLGPRQVNYYLGIPKLYTRSTAFPLVIKLVSATAFPNPSSDSDAIAKLYTSWIKEELTLHPETIIVMPVLDPRENFGPSYTGMNAVYGSLQHAAKVANIDPARVTLIGTETAAPTVWDLGLCYTTYFAAIAPFAGFADADWQRTRLMNLRNTAVITWHDVDDKTIKLEETCGLVDVLNRFKYSVDFEQTHGIGHAPTTQVYDQLSSKLTKCRRALYPAEVVIQSTRPDTMFNRLDWVQMYQPSRAGSEHRTLFHHAGEYMVTNANTMSIRAKITENHLEADTDNVESMRFYLNDQMIDFSKPVTITVNHRNRFTGMLQPDVTEMLNDQLFLGRGWRYFTAVVDVDFGEDKKAPDAPTSAKSK